MSFTLKVSGRGKTCIGRLKMRVNACERVLRRLALLKTSGIPVSDVQFDTYYEVKHRCLVNISKALEEAQS